MGICGAYRPGTGQLLSVVAPRIGGREFARLLRKLAARAQRTGRLLVVVLDNAQLHKGRTARRVWAALRAWVRPFWLPAYCPDLNDIERIWKREKERYFANDLARSPAAFLRRIQRRFRSLAHTQCRAGAPRRVTTIRISRMLKEILRAA